MTKPIDLDRILKLASEAHETPDQQWSKITAFRNACDPTTITAMAEELKEARQALAFYADRGNWFGHMFEERHISWEDTESPEHVGGELARKHMNKWGLE